MIITTYPFRPDGSSSRWVEVGDALTGLRIVEVRISAHDVAQRGFREWFIEVVMQRFAGTTVQRSGRDGGLFF